MENEILICDCGSLEHQIIIMEDEEDNWVYVYIRLKTYKNFFKRLWAGLRYAFGYKSKYGDFDSIIIRKQDHQKIIDLLEKYK